MLSPEPEYRSNFQDDAEVIASALGGDIDAFETLVRLHQGVIRGYLAARLAVSDDAEDLAQEVFVTAYRRRATFSGDRPIGSWFRGIARNLLRNHIRKFRAKPIGGSEELQALIDAGMGEQIDDGLLVALRECLSELDGPVRDLVEDRYLDGATVLELEKKTGRGYSALTMQLHRIRASLAKCIEGKTGFAPNT